jgi:hypothetical protein
MKNKIFTSVILSAMMLCTGITKLSAQAKSTFAGDISIESLPGREYGQVKVTVAYNGDIYVSRLSRLVGDTGWGGYQIFKSTDGGYTFHDIVGTLVTPIDIDYTAMDIIACGNNEADFKLIVARSRLNTATGDADMFMYWYKSDETIGGVILTTDAFNYSISRGWESLSLSSDTKNPASSSSPFSITLAAVKANANDSIIVYTSNDAGNTLVRRGLASTPQYFRNVSCATGTANTSSYGRVGVVWDEYGSSIDEFGNVKAHFIYADDATDFGYSGPYDVGFTNSEYKQPVIAMATDNSAGDIKGCITYVLQVTSADHDVFTRTFDQLITGAPQITSANNSLVVANDLYMETNPHVAYNPADKKFLFTYANTTQNKLGYKAADFSNINVEPVLITDNYRDNSGPLGDARPSVDGLTTGRNYFAWSEPAGNYLDGELNWPASVQSITTNLQEMKLYPNPATDNITLTFTAEEKDDATLIITDISGKTAHSAQANITVGNNQIPVILDNLPAGNYILRIAGSHTNTSAMFTVKQ